MAKKREDERPPTRLCLITPVAADESFAQALPRVISAGDVASVLIWGEKDEGAAYIERAKTLAAIAQTQDCAALVRANADLVRMSGADGFHADTNFDELKLALSNGEKFIVGAGNLKDRHAAMEAGEAGVDYVMFGDPRQGDPRQGDPRRPSDMETILDRVSWWQGLFEPPCIAVAQSFDDIGLLSRTGADFVALGTCLWNEADPVAKIAQAKALLAQA